MTHTPPRQTGRMTAILGVATVASTAAVISFSHVQALARSAGEPELTAWLLPLSIDGAIAAAGAGLSDVLWRVVCAGETLADAERAFEWPARSGKVVLRLALERVADFYRVG